MVDTIITSPLEPADRFARFRLINWWDQERLLEAKVLVIGSGALGNEILKNLALLGVGKIFVADLDLIENSNLSRSILFRESDNGRKKSETAAKAVREIHKNAKIQSFHGDVIYGLGLGVYEWADIAIVGLDNREARLAVNRNCWKTNTPWIDGAIEHLNGVARVFIPPDGACYECTMSDVDWQIIKSRKACGGLSRDDMESGKVPTTPTSASVIAGIQCQEAVKLLHGLEVLKSKGYIFNGLTHESYIVNYQKQKECPSHETYSQIQKLGRRTISTRIGDLLDELKSDLGAGAVIDFGRYGSDIIEGFDCASCGHSEPLFKPLGNTAESMVICPRCSNERTLKTFHSVDGSEGFLDKTFSEVGVPPFDIVVGRNGMDQTFLEFDGDAPFVLGPVSD